MNLQNTTRVSGQSIFVHLNVDGHLPLNAESVVSVKLLMFKTNRWSKVMQMSYQIWYART